MHVKRFTARTPREALAMVRQSLGDDAVVLSTRPAPDGVEVLAMTPQGLQQIEQLAVPAATSPADGAKAAAPATAAEAPATTVQQDVQRMSMSTLSFQDYVRERLLRRRATALRNDAAQPPAAAAAAQAPAAAAATAAVPTLHQVVGNAGASPDDAARREPVVAQTTAAPRLSLPAESSRADGAGAAMHRAPVDFADSVREQSMLEELREMKGLIEARFGALAFMDKLQRQPGQARLTQQLLECGLSPALIRRLAEGLPQDAGDEIGWAATVLERNLQAAEAEPALEDRGGVYALIGSTGVGKTTTTAKIAAAFAAKHGAGQLGLVTLDAYRLAAHEQLRAYGRILGVPVHTAHDRASLEDLLELLSAKRMVLVDTAGMAQRDTRTRELLEMLSHRSISKLLVVNAASQGETIEDVLLNWRAESAAGVVLSKIDEAAKLGPALDAVIRHKLKVVAVANGQRVPEDWHRLSAHALVQRALRSTTGACWRLQPADVNLIFAGAPLAASTAAGHAALHA